MLHKRISIPMAGFLASLLLTAQQPPVQKPTIEVDLIHLTPYGFVPKQLTRKPGPHLLVLRNVTGLRNPSLSITLGGPVQKQHQLTPSNPHWKEILDLPPGNFTLTESTHPTWVCTITVQ
jgi:hypothetical protein